MTDFSADISRYSQQQVLENREIEGATRCDIPPYAELSAIRILILLLNTHCVALVIIAEQKFTIGWRQSDSRSARVSMSQVGTLAPLARMNNAKCDKIPRMFATRFKKSRWHE